VSLRLHSLLSLDPKSEEFAELFQSCMLSKDERMNILALSDQDTRIFIEIIDGVRSSRMLFGACFNDFYPGYEGIPGCAV